jgi:hypothetical protein
MPLLLTAAERERFATYLEHEAQSDEMLAEQASNIGHEAFARKLRVEAIAARVVAGKLREIEDQTI